MSLVLDHFRREPPPGGRATNIKELAQHTLIRKNILFRRIKAPAEAGIDKSITTRWKGVPTKEKKEQLTCS